MNFREGRTCVTSPRNNSERSHDSIDSPDPHSCHYQPLSEPMCELLTSQIKFATFWTLYGATSAYLYIFGFFHSVLHVGDSSLFLGPFLFMFIPVYYAIMWVCLYLLNHSSVGFCWWCCLFVAAMNILVGIFWWIY